MRPKTAAEELTDQIMKEAARAKRTGDQLAASKLDRLFGMVQKVSREHLSDIEKLELVFSRIRKGAA